MSIPLLGLLLGVVTLALLRRARQESDSMAMMSVQAAIAEYVDVQDAWPLAWSDLHPSHTDVASCPERVAVNWSLTLDELVAFAEKHNLLGRLDLPDDAPLPSPRMIRFVDSSLPAKSEDFWNRTLLERILVHHASRNGG